MGERIAVHHRREHSRLMQELSDRKKQEFYLQQQGKTRPVLWESDIKGGKIYGFTDNYIRVRRPVASPTEAEKLANTIDGFTLRRFVANEEVFEDC